MKWMVEYNHGNEQVNDLLNKSKIRGVIRRMMPSFSLSVKLTLYFVLFGIVIGYISFVLYTVGSAKHNIDLAYRTLVPMLQEITGSKGQDFISDLAGRQNNELFRIYNIILKTTQATYGKIVPGVFFFDVNDGRWKEVHIDRDNAIHNIRVRQEEIPALNECVLHEMYHSSQLFFGKSDRVSFMMRLPMEGARNVYVLSLTLDREGITGFIKHNVERILLFSTLILLISGVLGKFFAYRVTAPIRKLSEVAHERASGNYTGEFSLDRSDEIGVLANSLNVMTEKIDSHVREIERRIKTMETMNQIDKAVLSSISRADLLERVIGLVSSLFRSSSTAMALYDEEKQVFDILTRFTGISPGIRADNPYVPTDHVDEGSMQRMKQVFQFSRTEAHREYRDLFEHLVGDDFGSGINVPVYQSDAYCGSLVLSRDDDRGFTPKEVVSITMLADQVGVALQSIRAVEEKEELLIGILIALTRSIDAKSKWTAGHSERVATYSEKTGGQPADERR